MTQINPIQRGSTNKTKNNTHNNQSANENTEEEYNHLINNTDYFTAFGFLLAVLAYELAHDKQTSD